jgi:hypothetical protein
MGDAPKTQTDDSRAVPQARRLEATLLLRVWFEDDDLQRMRIRGVPLPRGSGGEAVWTTVEDTVDAITLWLTGVALQRQSKANGSTADHRA